jgi:hypothetical protein
MADVPDIPLPRRRAGLALRRPAGRVIAAIPATRLGRTPNVEALNAFKCPHDSVY